MPKSTKLKEKNDMKKLEAKLDTLENTVRTMAEPIEILEDKLHNQN